MKKAKVLIFLILASVIIGLSATIGPRLYYKYFYSHGFLINKIKYPVTGIDVSKHTGRIDWQEIKDQKIDFVFVKASEGEAYEDPAFKMNFEGAKRAQLLTGAYHFYRFNKDGRTQALNFLSKIKALDLDFPPVLDVEEWGNSNFRNKKTAQITKEIKDFVNEVESKVNSKVIIYTNESTFDKYIKGHLDDNPLWICTFRQEPRSDMKWTFWQYSHNGKLRGAEGKLDINTFNGTKKDWENFLRK
jgi:lysozyme